ncbi:TonB-dependent hemoglobin/transferrin/lactoferrin family receptor [Pusillimonas sp. MFBS29]|uniref:TonB-dependent hemoglobin/transferrin/lactoferrin family receptor n=1 Tax=Pusillimonas sp. MFBS29 TaxID=2886690 RepID=UPI001D109380|nr:TonB-dependent hemoglobin/transferrin/lactoferrin family receptor [Pusillimonas sp. MFBS29]MCC2595047.1 TonB-dependent hemoglobin/transferrin/lactoferrin family receptor [Pusillimonas sp. MFBS29]
MRKSTAAWWSGAFLAVVAAQAVAQSAAPATNSKDDQPVQALTPVLVQGQVASELPEGSTVTTRRQLDERAIESWEDFSRRGEPGVNFSTANNSVNIRGMDEDRVVTRVDGIRIPWLNDGARGEKGGLNTVNFNALSSVDLVRAAGAPQSGSLVGYLNLRTLGPDDLLTPDQNFGALVKSGYDSADDSWSMDAALAGSIGQTGTSWLLLAGQRKGHELENMGNVGGYGALREEPNPESYTQRNAMLKLQHDFTLEHRLTLSGEIFKRTGTTENLHQQGTSSYAVDGNSTDEEFSRKRAVLGYEYRAANEKSAVSHGEIKAYWQRSYQDSALNAMRLPDRRGSISFGPIPVGQMYGYAYPYGPYGRDNSVQETGKGVLTAWQGYLTSTAVQHHWAAGAEWYGSRLEQHSGGYDNCPASLRPITNPAFSLGPRNCEMLHTNQSDVPQVDGDTWSLWAQDEISWADGKYALTPALRFDSYKYSPEAGGAYDANPNAQVTPLNSASGQRLSPSLLAAYRASETLSFYGKYGYGYKAPSATQLYTNYGAPGTYLRVGNPNLEAEISRGWELGVEAGDNELGGRLSVFDNRYRNFIEAEVPVTPDSPEWNPAWDGLYPMGVTAYANRARVRIYGAELSGHWSINGNWYTWGSLAWARGKDQDTDRYLNSVAPLKAILALGYRSGQWGAEAITTLVKRRSEVEYPEAADGVSTPDFQAPGYGLLDLTAWWTPQAAKGLRLQAGIYNAFDKKYWNALDVPRPGRDARPIDYYTQPGRNFRVSLTYQY